MPSSIARSPLLVTQVPAKKFIFHMCSAVISIRPKMSAVVAFNLFPYELKGPCDYRIFVRSTLSSRQSQALTREMAPIPQREPFSSTALTGRGRNLFEPLIDFPVYAVEWSACHFC